MTKVKVGDKIYIPSRCFISHGEDDVMGGLATITKVVEHTNVGQICQFVEVAEVLGTSYNWTLYLKDIQEKLKTQFGDKSAYPDPDYDSSPWLEEGDIVNGEVYHGPDRW